MSQSGPFIRTYGKKSALKRKTTPDNEKEPSPGPVTDAGQKRRKMSTKMSSKSLKDDADGGPMKTFTNGKNPNREHSQHIQAPAPSEFPGTPKRRNVDKTITTMPTPSPMKLSKRMLSRSKTDPALEQKPPSPPPALVDRTPSLPVVSTSLSKTTVDTPTISTYSAHSSSATSKSSVNRTYAGQYRSFLVPLPSADPTADPLEDAFAVTESYSSLRSRWGIDEVEEDPPSFTSPASSRSYTSTPNGSPSKSRKGKEKATPISRMPTLPDGLSNPLKSISELRHKGETRRFLDEMGFLFEGMRRTAAVGLRQASAMEIINKFCDPDAFRKAKAADCFIKTWEMLLEAGAGQMKDEILDILLVAFCQLVACDILSLADLSERSESDCGPFEDADIVKSLPEVLFQLLEHLDEQNDLLGLMSPKVDFKQIGVKKKDQSMLSSVHKTLERHMDRLGITQLSTIAMIQNVLQHLPSNQLPVAQFPVLLTSLRRTIGPPAFSSSIHESLISKQAEVAAKLDYNALTRHLRLIETYLLDRWKEPPPLDGIQLQPSHDDNWKVRNIDLLARARSECLGEALPALAICTELRGRAENDDENDTQDIQQCQEMLLRVLVNLTHNDPTWGSSLLSSPFTLGYIFRTIHKYGILFNQSLLQTSQRVEYDEDATQDDMDEGDRNRTIAKTHPDAVHALDILSLALGVLTNLVQTHNETKNRIRKTRLNPSCSLKKITCATKCSCNSPSTGIDILVNLYAQHPVKSDESLTTPTATSLEDPSPEARAEADASVIRGHLAVLFGLLMMDSPENQRAILDALPSPGVKGKASERTKVNRLVEHAGDFILFYNIVNGTQGHDEREGQVAQGVVKFLVTLRDEVL